MDSVNVSSYIYIFFLLKVLELSETYCPEVSDYRQGRITEIQPNGQITVEIIGKGLLNSHQCKGNDNLQLTPTNYLSVSWEFTVLIYVLYSLYLLELTILTYYLLY